MDAVTLVFSTVALLVSVVSAVVTHGREVKNLVLQEDLVKLQRRLAEVEEGRVNAALQARLVSQKIVRAGEDCHLRVINDGGGVANEVRVFSNREASGVGLELTTGSQWNRSARSCMLAPGQQADYVYRGEVDPGIVEGSITWMFQGEKIHEARDFT